MRKFLAIMLLVLGACDGSDSGGQREVNGANWTKIPCPSYSNTSGLFKIQDPDNGNTIYLHLGQHESSLFVLKPSPEEPKK